LGGDRRGKEKGRKKDECEGHRPRAPLVSSLRIGFGEGARLPRRRHERKGHAPASACGAFRRWRGRTPGFGATPMRRKTSWEREGVRMRPTSPRFLSFLP
jgi:hypothetical protein